MNDILYSGYLRDGDKKAVNFQLVRCPHGVEVSVAGYESGAVYLDYYEGKLKVVVTADPETDDPTHVIDLEGVKLCDSKQTQTG